MCLLRGTVSHDLVLFESRHSAHVMPNALDRRRNTGQPAQQL
jgi:hypothetical protein